MRLFNDLYPEVQRAIREANYIVQDINELISKQHAGVGEEALANFIRRRDIERYNREMKPKLNHESSTSNGEFPRLSGMDGCLDTF